ncbi:hypothetical protein L5849_08300 [Erythrobacter sp. SN021]|uniref:hypothetical protein n=1 Tax=Erythrobacter sp. SN021 TaxID=2912574 RepID=UPI001F3B42A4|nr:hypothetical protein [Erythrobacter sp. SN021]MCF8882697.1 hypothetical protein [Erythrobacter sp. SN021]
MPLLPPGPDRPAEPIAGYEDLRLWAALLAILLATFMSAFAGTSAHSWQAVAASGMSIGFKGANHAAKAMVLMGVELYSNPDLRAQAKAEFTELLGPDYTYESLLGDREPPLDYRR